MFSQHELEIMKLLWSEERGLTKTEIVDMTPKKTWKPNTIHFLLNKLLDKDAIEVVGLKQSGKVYARSFSAKVTPADYFADTLPRAVDLGGILSAMAARDTLSHEALDQLQLTIDLLKGRLNA